MDKRLAVLLLICAVPAQAKERVLSLDYCADQYVMALAEPEHIVAVSPAAGSEYSYFADRSSGLPRLAPTGEHVLLAEPSVVVRQWGGGHNAAAYLDRLDIPIAQIEFGTDIESARRSLRSVAAALGAKDKAERLIEKMNDRLARVAAHDPPASARPRALYVTSGGLTTGAGTFVHEAMIAAGVTNMGAEGDREGWLDINLEAVALDPPDLIVGAFFDHKSNHVNYWSVARHNFLQDAMRETPTVMIPGAQLACSAWFFVDAVETIHQAAQRLSRKAVASRP